jgi:hypothetical protein
MERFIGPLCDMTEEPIVDHMFFDLRTNYVNRDTAIANNLTDGAGDTFILHAGSWNRVAAAESGREFVRLVSLQSS